MRRTIWAVFASLVPASGFAALVLTVRVDTAPYTGRSIGFAPVEGAKPQDAKHSIVNLTLAPGYTRSQDESEITIRDAERRVVYVTRDGQTVRRSLLGEAAAHAAEIDNRAYLHRLTGEHSTPLVVSEHELSIRSAGGSEGVVRSEKGGVISFRGGELELAEYSRDLIEATPAERAGFTRFLAYSFGLHPDILDELRKLNGIPLRLRTIRHHAPREARIEVTDAKRLPDAPYKIGASRSTIESDPEVGTAAVEAQKNVTPEARAAEERGMIASASRQAAEKKALDAWLALMEYWITSNGDAAQEVMAIAATVKGDPVVTKFNKLIHPESAEEAKASVATLGKLRQAVPAKGYLISIFEGNLLTMLGQKSEAQKKFIEALTGHPRLAGVWKDLGDVYYSRYDAARAWDCYNIARRLAPRNRMMAEVTSFEENLVRENPAFF